jgi:hypothetical protein
VDRFYDLISLSAHWELSSISAHEVRALALEWKSHTVFSQFYLRDSWTLADGMSTLGPVVAATSVV